MKLYTAQAPSPYRVKVFVSEKGIVLPTEEVSLQVGGTRQLAFLQKNSLAEVPVHELDDGSYLTESLAICRYLEAIYPAPPLMGDTPLQVAMTLCPGFCRALFYSFRCNTPKVITSTATNFR